MDCDAVLIKTEPENEICGDSSNVFECDLSEKSLKSEVNLEVEYSQTHFNNEEVNKTTTTFNCKREPVDSFNNEKNVLKDPLLKIEDIFNEDDQVDLSKLKQLMNQSNNTPECSNRSSGDEELDTKRSAVVPRLSCDNHKVKQRKKKKERKIKIYKCDFCNYETVVKSHLDKHFNSMHNEQRTKISCQFCNKSFALKYSLDNHVLKQHKQDVKGDIKDFISSKIHKCAHCPFKTTFLSHFNVHINSNHNEQRSKMKCQFCNKLFAYKYSLDDHLLKQHSNKVNSDIKELITSNIYTCNICSYQSAVKSKLTRHINLMHKDKTKIRCQLCDKLFSYKYSLDDHLLKLHKNQLTPDVKDLITSIIYTCDVCDYQTAIKSKLNTHIKLNHEGTKLPCPFCDKSFVYKYSLDVHILKHHSGEIKP